MCGIAGIFRFDEQGIDKSKLERLCQEMRHRGPDDEGYSLFDNSIGLYAGVDTNPALNLTKLTDSQEKASVGFAFRRLSIIDVSEAGHQPMISDDQRYMMVFNGELYNYQELKTELETMGFSFKSASDSEVVLNAYIAWGSKSVQKFNGMWSISIFDVVDKILFASRDRFGIKPFYYIKTPQEFIFASEIKQIVTVLTNEMFVDDEVALQYLFDGAKDFSERTFFKDIFQLEPGCNLIIKDNKVKVERYWDFEINDTYDSTSNNDLSEKEFVELFKSSVEYRYRADVPVGVALSGGLDSSSIAVMANQISVNPLKTFTVVFDDPKYDERQFAQVVSESISCTRYECNPKLNGLENEMDEMLYQLEEPIRSISTYSQWCLMKTVKKNGVTVLLEGQGADELLGGYQWYYESYFYDLISKFSLIKFFSEVRSFASIHNRSYIRVSISYLSKWLKRKVKVLINKKEFNKLLNTNGSTLLNQNQSKSFNTAFGQQLDFGLRYLIRELLNYGDKTSMKFSVENRVPFLDYRFVEALVRTPLSQKINKGKTKNILRESMKDLLPNKINNRYDKLGFTTPQELWQRNELKRDIQKELLDSNFLELKYFKSDQVRKYIEDYFSEKHNDYSFVWRCYNFSKWIKIFNVNVAGLNKYSI